MGGTPDDSSTSRGQPSNPRVSTSRRMSKGDRMQSCVRFAPDSFSPGTSDKRPVDRLAADPSPQPSLHSRQSLAVARSQAIPHHHTETQKEESHMRQQQDFGRFGALDPPADPMKASSAQRQLGLSASPPSRASFERALRASTVGPRGTSTSEAPSGNGDAQRVGTGEGRSRVETAEATSVFRSQLSELMRSFASKASLDETPKRLSTKDASGDSRRTTALQQQQEGPVALLPASSSPPVGRSAVAPEPAAGRDLSRRSLTRRSSSSSSAGGRALGERSGGKRAPTSLAKGDEALRSRDSVGSFWLAEMLSSADSSEHSSDEDTPKRSPQSKTLQSPGSQGAPEPPTSVRTKQQPLQRKGSASSERAERDSVADDPATAAAEEKRARGSRLQSFGSCRDIKKDTIDGSSSDSKRSSRGTALGGSAPPGPYKEALLASLQQQMLLLEQLQQKHQRPVQRPTPKCAVAVKIDESLARRPPPGGEQHLVLQHLQLAELQQRSLLQQQQSDRQYMEERRLFAALAATAIRQHEHHRYAAALLDGHAAVQQNEIEIVRKQMDNIRAALESCRAAAAAQRQEFLQLSAELRQNRYSSSSSSSRLAVRHRLMALLQEQLQHFNELTENAQLQQQKSGELLQQQQKQAEEAAATLQQQQQQEQQELAARHSAVLSSCIKQQQQLSKSLVMTEQRQAELEEKRKQLKQEIEKQQEEYSEERRRLLEKGHPEEALAAFEAEQQQKQQQQQKQLQAHEEEIARLQTMKEKQLLQQQQLAEQMEPQKQLQEQQQLLVKHMQQREELQREMQQQEELRQQLAAEHASQQQLLLQKQEDLEQQRQQLLQESESMPADYQGHIEEPQQELQLLQQQELEVLQRPDEILRVQQQIEEQNQSWLQQQQQLPQQQQQQLLQQQQSEQMLLQQQQQLPDQLLQEQQQLLQQQQLDQLLQEQQLLQQQQPDQLLQQQQLDQLLQQQQQQQLDQLLQQQQLDQLLQQQQQQLLQQQQPDQLLQQQRQHLAELQKQQLLEQQQLQQQQMQETLQLQQMSPPEAVQDARLLQQQQLLGPSQELQQRLLERRQQIAQAQQQQLEQQMQLQQQMLQQQQSPSGILTGPFPETPAGPNEEQLQKIRQLEESILSQQASLEASRVLPVPKAVLQQRSQLVLEQLQQSSEHFGGLPPALSPSTCNPHAVAAPTGLPNTQPVRLYEPQEAAEREHYKLLNEELQKRCVGLQQQLLHLQLQQQEQHQQGGALQNEQIAFATQKLAQMEAYSKALEKQNNELLQTADGALQQQRSEFEEREKKLQEQIQQLHQQYEQQAVKEREVLADFFEKEYAKVMGQAMDGQQQLQQTQVMLEEAQVAKQNVQTLEEQAAAAQEEARRYAADCIAAKLQGEELAAKAQELMRQKEAADEEKRNLLLLVSQLEKKAQLAEQELQQRELQQQQEKVQLEQQLKNQLQEEMRELKQKLSNEKEDTLRSFQIQKEEMDQRMQRDRQELEREKEESDRNHRTLLRKLEVTASQAIVTKQEAEAAALERKLLAAKCEKLERELAEHQAQQAQLVIERQRTLEKQLDEERKINVQHAERLKRLHTEQLEELQGRYQNAIQNLREKGTEKAQKKASALQEKLAQLEAEQEERKRHMVTQHQQELRKHKETTEKEKSKLLQEVTVLKSKAEEDTAILKKKHTDAIAALEKEWQAKLDEANQHIELLEKRIKEEGEKKKQADAFRASLERHVGQLGEEVEDVHRRFRELMTKYETVKQHRDKALQKQEDLLGDLKRAKQQQQQLLQRAEEAEQLQQQAQQQVQHKAKQLEAAREMHEKCQNQLKAANADLAKKKKEMLEANERYKQMQKSLAEAMAEAGRRQQEVAPYKKRMQQRQGAIEDLQAELEILDSKHQHALKQLKAASTAQADNVRLSEEVTALKAALADAKNKWRKAQEESLDKDAQIRRFKREAEDAHDDLKTSSAIEAELTKGESFVLSQKLTAAEALVTELREARQAADERAAAAKAATAASSVLAEEKIKYLQDRISSLETEKNRLEKQLAQRSHMAQEAKEKAAETLESVRACMADFSKGQEETIREMVELFARKEREAVAAAAKMAPGTAAIPTAGVAAQLQELSQQLTELRQQQQNTAQTNLESLLAAGSSEGSSEIMHIIRKLVDTIANPHERRQQQPQPSAPAPLVPAIPMPCEARKAYKSMLSWLLRLKGRVPGVSLMQVLLSLSPAVCPQETAEAICALADYVPPTAGLEVLCRFVSPPCRAAAMWEAADRQQAVQPAAEEKLLQAARRVQQRAATETTGVPLEHQEEVFALLQAAEAAHPMSIVHAARGLGPLLNRSVTLKMLHAAQRAGATNLELAAAACRCLPEKEADAFCEQLEQGGHLQSRELVSLVEELLQLLQQALQLAGMCQLTPVPLQTSPLPPPPPPPPRPGSGVYASGVCTVPGAVLMPAPGAAPHAHVHPHAGPPCCSKGVIGGPATPLIAMRGDGKKAFVCQMPPHTYGVSAKLRYDLTPSTTRHPSPL